MSPYQQRPKPTSTPRKSTAGRQPKSADKVMTLYKRSEEHFLTQREAGEEAMRYTLNQPYSAAERQNAAKHKKPLLRYPVIMPILQTLVGNEQLSRRKAQISARTTNPKDIQVADVIQGRWNALNDEQDVEEKLEQAFYDALISPMGGWIERRFELNERGYLDFTYRVANNMRVYVDPNTETSDYDLSECQWVIKKTWMSLDEMMSRYEGVEEGDVNDELQVSWWEKVKDIPKRFQEGAYSRSEFYDKQNDRYCVLEMRERKITKNVRFYDPTQNRYMSLPRKEYRELKKENPGLRMMRESADDSIHITAIAPFFEDLVLEDREDPSPGANFGLFPVFSFALNAQISESVSLVMMLMDIQDDINKHKSQIRDYLTQLLSGAMFFSAKDRELVKDLRKSAHEPGGYYLSKRPDLIQRQQPGNVPPDLFGNTENSYEFGSRIANVFGALRGEAGKSGESGELFEAKVSQATTAINPYYENLSRARKAIAKDFVDNFGYVYFESDRLVSIIDEEGAHRDVFVNLNMAGQVINDVSNPSLHVELDEGDDNKTAREENFQKLLALTNIVAEINPQLADLKTLIKNAPVPGAAEMVEHIEQMLQAQAQAAERQEKMDRAQQLIENMAKQRDMVSKEQEYNLKKQQMVEKKADGQRESQESQEA